MKSEVNIRQCQAQEQEFVGASSKSFIMNACPTVVQLNYIYDDTNKNLVK